MNEGVGDWAEDLKWCLKSGKRLEFPHVVEKGVRRGRWTPAVLKKGQDEWRCRKFVERGEIDDARKKMKE